MNKNEFNAVVKSCFESVINVNCEIQLFNIINKEELELMNIDFYKSLTDIQLFHDAMQVTFLTNLFLILY